MADITCAHCGKPTLAVRATFRAGDGRRFTVPLHVCPFEDCVESRGGWYWPEVERVGA